MIPSQYLCLLLFLLSQSCTFVRTIRYTVPSTLDHQRAFICDTIRCYPVASKPFNPHQLAYSEPFIRPTKKQGLPPIDQWVPEEYRLNAKSLDEFMKKTKTTAFIVIKNDTVLYEKYFNGAAVNQARIGFSVHKSIMTMLVAIAHEEGLLDINQAVADFIPEFTVDNRKNIRIHHLMNMNSGMEYYDAKSLLGLGNLYYSPNQYKFMLRRSKLAYEPGTHYFYSSLSSQILGICLEKAVACSANAYLEKKLWWPLGIQSDAYLTKDSKKHKTARHFGGLAMTARAMARIGKLLLDHGQWKGEQLVPAWFIDSISTRRAEMHGWGYIYCFKHRSYEDLNYRQNRYFYAEGYKGQLLFVSPQDSMVVIRQGDADRMEWDLLPGRLTSLIGRGYNDLTDTTQYLAQLAGRYRSADGVEMEFIEKKRDKYQRRIWRWKRKKRDFPFHRNVKKLHQMDKVSVASSNGSHRLRFYIDLQDEQVKGLYAYCPPKMKTVYFKKVE